MTNEEAVRKLEYSKTAYQMLIDEKVDSGKLVGQDVKGEWKADTPLDEAYKSMIEALEMGIEAIKALDQEPCRYWQNGKCNGNTEVCEDAISRQDVLDLAKKGILVSNGNYESVCKAINELPSVTPLPKAGHWEWLTENKYRCSNCKHETRVDECMSKPMYDFCPFCRARMESEEE